jgi:DNA-binding MarR family transcriptional regulator
LINASTDELADAVLAASRVLVAVAARSLVAAPADVTLSQYRVLVVLATQGSQRPSDLAAQLGVAASSITRMADRLVGKKLIKRRLRRDNRRECRLEITDAGHAIVDAVTVARRREFRRLLKRIPEHHREQLLSTLTEFNDAAADQAFPSSPLGWPG